MLRRALALTALALGAAAPAAGASTELNVIPQGQTQPGVSWGSAPGILPADTQARMYDRLTPLFRNVTDAQLVPSADGSGWFKSAKLLAESDPSFVLTQNVAGEVAGIGPVSARIKRDPYGVPHVYAGTDAGVIFGAGYATAQDRSLLLNQARFNGIASLIDVPGVSGIQLLLGLYDYKPSAKIVSEITRQQTAALNAAGTQGKQVLRDIDTYIAGINLWYSQNQPSAPRFTRADIFAFNGIKAQFLGEGGGEEVPNALFLDALRDRLGSGEGSRAFEDLRGRSDPETATTTTKRFDWQTNVSVTRPRGVVRLEQRSFRDSFVPLPGGAGASRAGAASVDHPRGPRQRASNILIVSGKRSQSGRPLFVGGPQIGYNYPGLTLEMGLYGPDIKVRGATSAPFPGYMLIGRGEGYAWTLTSAGTDLIDTYAETLCAGSSRRYVYRGRCLRMKKVDAGTISKGGKTTKVVFYRTVHGPVIGYARKAGSRQRVALSQRRSSYGRETTDLLFNQQMTFGRVKSASDFIAAAKKTPQTFNSFYASATESAFYTSGRLPLRPKGVNPDLPTDGRGRFEWTGYLAPSRHPQARNPASGLIVNWNNKPAKGFPAGDERWSENSIQRDDLLNGELARSGRHTVASVLAAANAAATEDVRIVRFWPTLAKVLAKGSSPSAAATAAKQALDAWAAAGGSRVDANGDGLTDAPGAAVMDAAWPAISSAGLCDRLGAALCRQLEGRNPRVDMSQYGGWHQYMWKDLRRLLGEKVRGAYHLRYCAKGRLSTCAKEMWAALDGAGRRLTAEHGANPAGWLVKAGTIEFTPVPLRTMQWTNRPSGIHQVMELGG
ncbi:MAG: penicillin acylase family protein [Solirubrobacteraceae bacterium]|nr:penicillin acylase family protein [Solirubrobacteraceae bacterium]